MKKLLLSTLFIALAFGSVMAQNSGNWNRQKDGQHGRQKQGQYNRQSRNGEMNGRSGTMFQKFYDELNLTSDQRARAEQLNTQFKTDMQSLRSNTSLTQEQKRYAMQTLMQRHQANFRSILNYEQTQKYDAMVQQMQSRGAKQHGGKSDQRRSTSTFGAANSQSFLSQISNGSSLNTTSANDVALASLLGNNFSVSDILQAIPLESILALLGGLFK